MTYLPPRLVVNPVWKLWFYAYGKLPEPLPLGSKCEEPLKYIMYIVCWGLQPRIMLPGLIDVVLT